MVPEDKSLYLLIKEGKYAQTINTDIVTLKVQNFQTVM
jgi:hypothetical protein